MNCSKALQIATVFPLIAILHRYKNREIQKKCSAGMHHAFCNMFSFKGSTSNIFMIFERVSPCKPSNWDTLGWWLVRRIYVAKIFPLSGFFASYFSLYNSQFTFLTNVSSVLVYRLYNTYFVYSWQHFPDVLPKPKLEKKKKRQTNFDLFLYFWRICFSGVCMGRSSPADDLI